MGIKMRRGYILVIVFLLCSAAMGYAEDSTADDGRLHVTVFSEAQVSGERILLGHVSKISGGSEALRRIVSKIDLGPAPRPGRQRHISGSSISVALAHTGSFGKEMSTTIPDRVVVTGASQHISESALKEIFKQYVMNAVGEDEVVFSRMDVRGVKPLPIGKITLTPSGNRKGDIKGKTSLRLAVAVDGKNCGQVTVSGWVDRYTQVVCTAKAVPRGSILSAEDLCLKRINIAKAPDRLVFDIDQAVGKQVRTNLQIGKYLQEHKLVEVPLIEKGDRVKLLLSAGPVSISTFGVAKAAGNPGDQIRVENLSSEKMVVGRVLDASTVEVLF